MNKIFNLFSVCTQHKQKIKMKINFDQIFKNSPTLNKKNFAPKQSQASTAQGYESLFTSMAKHQQPTKMKEPDFSKSGQFINLIQSTKQDNYKYQYYKQSKLDDEPNQLTKNNKQSKINNNFHKKIDYQKVTQRLYKPMQCKKSECKQIQLQQYNKKLEKVSLPLGAPKKNHRSLTQTCERLKEPSKLHERLYRQYFQKEFRNMQLQNEYEQKNQKKLQLYENKQYLGNYINFYDRLQNQVNRKAMKQQYYDQNPQIDIKSKGQAFQPNITASKRSLAMLSCKPSIVPKEQKHAIKGYATMRAEQDKKLRLSLSGSLQNLFATHNRSQQIIKRRQDKIITRLCQVFNHEGYFSLNPQAIAELKEQEFQIIFPFIQDFQGEKDIPIEQFEEQLRQYCNSLEGADKIKLRHTLPKRQHAKRKKQQQEIQKAPQNTPLNKSLRSDLKKKKPSDYLNKIQNFV